MNYFYPYLFGGMSSTPPPASSTQSKFADEGKLPGAPFHMRGAKTERAGGEKKVAPFCFFPPGDFLLSQYCFYEAGGQQKRNLPCCSSPLPEYQNGLS